MRKSLTELIEKYADRIYNLNLRLAGGNIDDANDLTQETFLNAYKGLGSFREDSNFYTWLYRIAINTFNASYRQKPCVPPEPLEDWEDKVISPDSPEERFLLAEIQEICFSAIIKHLQLPQRVVFVLAETQGLSILEISQILGISEGAVKSKLHRARQNLINFFKERCGLMRKTNHCKCRMWRDYAKEQTRCITNETTDAPIVIKAETIDENLSDLARITMFYHSLSKKGLDRDALSNLRQEILKGKIFSNVVYV